MKISRILLYLAILSVLAPIGDANLGAGLVALTKWITSVLPKYVAQGAVRVAGKVATNVGKASANAGKAVLNTGKNARTLVASKGANLGRGVAQGFRSLGGKGASIIHRGRQVLQKGQHFVQRTYRRVGGNFYKRLKNVPIVDPARSSKWNRLRVIAEVVKQTLKSPKFYYKGRKITFYLVISIVLNNTPLLQFLMLLRSPRQR